MANINFKKLRCLIGATCILLANSVFAEESESMPIGVDVRDIYKLTFKDAETRAEDPEKLMITGYVSEIWLKSNNNVATTSSSNSYGDFINESGIYFAYDFLPNVFLMGSINFDQMNQKPLRTKYLFADVSHTFEGLTTNIGSRIGRLKIPFGLYNEARLNPRSRKQIMLPQSVYIQQFDLFSTSGDGISLYANKTFSNGGQLSITGVYAKPVVNEDDIDRIKESYYMMAIPGEFHHEGRAYVFDIEYKTSNMTLQYSFAYLTWSYTQPMPMFPIPSHSLRIPINQFSFNYDFGKWEISTELLVARNIRNTSVIKNTNVYGWYSMLEYKYDDQLRFYTSFGKWQPANVTESAAALGLKPTDFLYTDLTLGASYNFNSQWNIKAEVHRADGWFVLNRVDQDKPMTNPWHIFAMSVTYSF